MAEFSSACTGSSPVACWVKSAVFNSHLCYMRIIGGLVLAGIGIAIIVFSASLTKTLGRRERAERHLWGTMQGYLVIGFVVIIIGIMSIFGASFVKPDPSALQLH